jgi:RNA chaperone Hfq
MGSEDRSPDLNSPSISHQRPTLKQEEWRCTDPFLNRVRKEGVVVDLYLKSGTMLIGYIDEYDGNGIVFDGGPKGEDPKKQLIFRSAISTIVLRQEG